MGKFVTKTGKNGEFYFNLLATNGQVILSSEGYTTKSARANGIESVKKNAAILAHFEKKASANGQFHFNLKAINGQIVGSSQMYHSEAACDNGIESVHKNAPEAEVVEEL